MREIKFRAWDTKFQKMYFSHDENDDGARVMLFHGDWEVDTCYPDSGDDAGTIPCDGKKAVLMQFTGLKDESGKEIYEGDIVLWKWLNHDVTASVKWDEDRANFYAGERYGQTLGAVKVIGNIYENPELLK
jgi:uncharacterized phage protein (TIGR01671 family)